MCRVLEPPEMVVSPRDCVLFVVVVPPRDLDVRRDLLRRELVGAPVRGIVYVRSAVVFPLLLFPLAREVGA